MRRDLEKLRQSKAEEYFEAYIPSEFRKFNQKFFCEILVEYFKGKPDNLSYYFDLSDATGDRLELIAYNFFSIKRNFKNITLSDDEMRMLINFAILMNSETNLSAYKLNQSIRTLFKGSVIVNLTSKGLDLFFTKELISNNVKEALSFYDLIPRIPGIPINIFSINQGYRIFKIPSGIGDSYSHREGGISEVGEIATTFLNIDDKKTIF